MVTLRCLSLSLALLIQAEAGAQWKELPAPPSDVRAFAPLGNDLFASGFGGGVVRFSPGDTSWASVSDSLPVKDVPALIAVGGSLMAGTLGGGCYRSDDLGASWVAANVGLPRDPYDTTSYAIVQSLLAIDSVVYAGTYYGVYVTSDRGSTWQAVNAGLSYLNVVSFASTDAFMFAGTNGGGLFRRARSGGTWTRIGQDSLMPSIRSICAFGSNVFSTSGGFVGVSVDNGSTWRTVDPDPASWDILSLATDSAHVFAGTYHGGILVSTDLGMSWQSRNAGLPADFSLVSVVVVVGNELLAVSNGPGLRLWSHSIADLVTLAPLSLDRVPTDPMLFQNFPNPFNPTTSIQYSLAAPGGTISGGIERQAVRVSIHDLIGREVAVLVDDHQSSGLHAVVWDASAVPSGIYYCRLRSGGFTTTKKLVVLK